MKGASFKFHLDSSCHMRIGSLALLLTMLAGASSDAQTPTMAHARQEFAARNWDAAKQEFTLLARANPNDVTPVLYLGKIALAQNETEEGIRHFERCAKIDDRNAECHAWLGNALGNAAMRASKIKLPFLAKRTKKEFDRAVELDPTSVEGRMGLLQYYMQAPGFLGGSMDRAREQATEMEKHDRLRGAIAFGLLADHEKKVKEAEAAYLRAIAVAPDSAAGYNAVINLYVREKRWNDAFAMTDRFIAKVPSETGALLALARIAVLSGQQLDRGEDAVKRWLANPPKDANANLKAVAHYRYASILEQTGRRELARAEYERSLALNPRLDDAKKAVERLRD